MLCDAHRDRLRVRPFEAGATAETNHLEKVPTPAGARLERRARQMSCCEAAPVLTEVGAVGHGDPPLRTSVGFLRCAKPVRHGAIRSMNAVPEPYSDGARPGVY